LLAFTALELAAASLYMICFLLSVLPVAWALCPTVDMLTPYRGSRFGEELRGFGTGALLHPAGYELCLTLGSLPKDIAALLMIIMLLPFVVHLGHLQEDVVLPPLAQLTDPPFAPHRDRRPVRHMPSGRLQH